MGNKHITPDVSNLSIKKQAIGGVQEISFRLNHPIDAFDPDLAALSKVYVQDGRSAVTIAEGRLTDPSRGAGSDGQVWEMTAFGPAQHATDITFPYVLVDQSVTDGWRRTVRKPASATDTTGPAPDDPNDGATPGIVLQFPGGVAVDSTCSIAMRYDRIRESGQKLARVHYTHDAGITDTLYSFQGVTRTDGGTGEIAATATFSTTFGVQSVVVVTDFPNGRNTFDVRIDRTGGATNVADDLHWGAFVNITIRALLLTAAGAEITTGYTQDYVLPHEIVKDLLGRVLTQFDGALATVDTGSTKQLDQLAYPDGVTAETVLADVMVQEPAYYWTTGPSTINGKYAFYWKPWPTTVRYEVTIAGGGSFPTSTQELYNRVMVRYRNPSGQIKTPVFALACLALDNQSVVRQAFLDLGDEASSATAAQQAGDAFLVDHNVPPNAGTLTISGPIRDLTTGRMVQPFEIEPAELVRVRGIESYPSALNASSSDGLTVFRIWAMTYDGDSDAATLELDSYSRTEINALTALIKQRNRKR